MITYIRSYTLTYLSVTFWLNVEMEAGKDIEKERQSVECVSVCRYLCLCICVCAYVRSRMYVCMYVCVCVCGWYHYGKTGEVFSKKTKSKLFKSIQFRETNQHNWQIDIYRNAQVTVLIDRFLFLLNYQLDEWNSRYFHTIQNIYESDLSISQSTYFLKDTSYVPTV